MTSPTGTVQRMLVPGTAGPDTETLPSVVFADDSQTIFLLWETELNIHPLLQLAGFDGTKWSQVIQVTGNPFALKTSPQFTSTRDSFPSLNPDGTTTMHYRTVLHVVWQELNSASQLESFYTPIVIKDGAYIGWNPIYNLDDFMPSPASSLALSAPQAALASSPLLQNGPDGRTVVVAYTSTLLNRLASIEIDVLPEQLGELAGKTRSHIVDLGKQYNYPTAPDALASMAADTRAQIVSQGSAFQPDVIQSIADQIGTQILGSQGQDLLTIAEKTRSHIVDLGATLCGWGLRSPSGVDLAKILEIGETSPVPDVSDLPDTVPFQFQFKLSSNLPVPRVGPGTVKLFSSQSGDRLIVSWAQTDRLFYRTSQGDGSWSDPKQLIFSSNLDINKAYQILGQRLGNH